MIEEHQPLIKFVFRSAVFLEEEFTIDKESAVCCRSNDFKIRQSLQNRVGIKSVFGMALSVFQKRIQLQFVVDLAEGGIAEVFHVVCADRKLFLLIDAKIIAGGFLFSLRVHFFCNCFEMGDRILVFFFQFIQVAKGPDGFLSYFAVFVTVSMDDREIFPAACAGSDAYIHNSFPFKKIFLFLL